MNGFDIDYIKLIQQLIKKEINFQEYLKKRGLSKYDNLKELKYIVNNNQYLLDEFLSLISVGLRCRALKGLFNLIDDEIAFFIDYSSSQISDFMRKNMEYSMESQVISRRTTSLEMLYDLAIILDLPLRYLENTSTEYEMIRSFTEYKTPKIKKMDLNRLIEEILSEMNQTSRLKRRIFGVRIKNNFFDAGDSKHICARVDIRENFFTIEMHLDNKANINYSELINLEETIGMKNEIYIRDAFLRTNQKLCILISIDDDDNLEENIIYLNKDFLWRNVLFSLKDKSIDELMEEREREFNFF